MEKEKYARENPEFAGSTHHYIAITFALKNDSEKIRIVFDTTLSGRLPDGSMANLTLEGPGGGIHPPPYTKFYFLT